MNIGGREISSEHPPYIIAEIGLNHAGSVDIACAMIDAAKRAGVSCVKTQTHIPNDEFCDEPAYPANAGGESIQSFVRRCALSEPDERRLFGYAREIGIELISTPFSHEAVARLERIGVNAYKAGSGQLRDLPLLRRLATTDKPVILSTGMGDIEDVRRAWHALSAGAEVALLHCTSEYPTPFNHVRLGALSQLASFGVYGLSDHTGTIWPSLGAVALGASIIEVHFKTPECPPGPDLAVSLGEKQLAELVTGANAIWQCRGGTKEVLPGEAETLKWFQASRRAV